MEPFITSAAMPYARQTRFSSGSEPVRKRHLRSIAWACEYARTHLTSVFSGLAPIPSSSTLDAAGPRSFFARSRAVVVSGQIVVHSGSLNETTTTLPRSERSETRLPNWSVRVKPGAAASSATPRSRFGFAIAGVPVCAAGTDGVVVEFAMAITAPMPTPTASETTRTVQCNRRDTPAQYGSTMEGQIRSPPVAVSSSLSASGIRWDLSDLEPDADQ